LRTVAVRLSELAKAVAAQVESVEARDASDAIARRLRDLGFVRGEPVRIVATGPLGGEPLLGHIGHTRFALRRSEAARVRVRLLSDIAAEALAHATAPAVGEETVA
jgi:ferrous iron transport protein A